MTEQDMTEPATTSIQLDPVLSQNYQAVQAGKVLRKGERWYAMGQVIEEPSMDASALYGLLEHGYLTVNPDTGVVTPLSETAISNVDGLFIQLRLATGGFTPTDLTSYGWEETRMSFTCACRAVTKSDDQAPACEHWESLA